jgi:hypothetical protein
MREFTVLVREVHVSHRRVFANSPEEAIERVRDCGDEEEIARKYSHTLDPETWTVETVT